MAKKMKDRPRKDLKELVRGLNEDLAHEYKAVITYRLYASLVKGPWRQELRNFFTAEIPDELMHAQTLADKIVALGGIPTGTPAPVTVATEARDMLRNALADEAETVERYIRRRHEAEAAGEFGLAVDLDSMIADETKHRDELQLMLARWE